MKDLIINFFFAWIVALTAICVFYCVANAQDGTEVDLGPGGNPVVNGIDVCRAASASAQNFLALTDTGYEPTQEEVAKIARYIGELEISSSVCLGLRIAPSRLTPDQRKLWEDTKKEPA